MCIPRISLFAALTLLLTFAALPRSTKAAENHDNCIGFIDSVPATITAQGTWCLNKDLGTAITSGAAITINTNNVTLDCNDFKLGGLAAGDGTLASGIHANGRSNIVVRHCSIRGFLKGIHLQGSKAAGGHVVEDSRFDGNTHFGIEVAGDGSVIRRNQVRDTGGSTVVGHAAGVRGTHNVDVLDNTVDGVVATTEDGFESWASGIEIVTSTANDFSNIRGNRVRRILAPPPSPTFGIWLTGQGSIHMRANDLVNSSFAQSGSSVQCSYESSRAILRDNVIIGFGATLSGYCQVGPGNVYVPLPGS